MAQFSAKERLIASLLSSSPRLKGIIKRAYIFVNYVIHRRSFRTIVFLQNRQIQLVESQKDSYETFFGYYDKSPENMHGWIIFNETSRNTSHCPSSNIPLLVNVINQTTKTIIPIGETLSYNWQQGCRTQWINNDKLIYNFFDQQAEAYKSAVYSVECQQVLRTYGSPVQDSYKSDYFLSINYRRIMNLRPDYGYRNLPMLEPEDMNRLDNDGIWQVSLSSGESKLIVSLSALRELQPKPTFSDAIHKVNHVMISPDGRSFIFIHRWYVGLRRYDRLIYCDFNNCSVLADDDMVSHMCWIDNNTVFGYLRYEGHDGFYFINIYTGKVTPCDAMNELRNGDGHPSCCGNWIVFDTYPDKSRVQHLYLYNRMSEEVYPLLQVRHGIRYYGESRCDMHPRFSPDGNRVYFDTVETGVRRLAYIDISLLTNTSC